MSDLSQQDNESTVIAENTDVYLDCGSGNKSQGTTTALALQDVHSLPPVRKKKIHEVRQQLAKGTYDIEERLNLILDQLLEDLVV
jgi:anti-sigma28 factor (negative regulator of flagellin synthesis)